MNPRALLDVVDHWVFDLDNTLYPADSALFAQIDARMTAYLRDHLHLSQGDARALQKRYYQEYGATLAGLMANHVIDPHHFLETVHDIDYAPVLHDGPLKALIDALPGEKLVFTNGSRGHARRTLARLGISESFDGVFSIEDGGFAPKPSHLAFQRLQARFGFSPGRALLFDDLVPNIGMAKAFGMRAVLVRSGQTDAGEAAHSDATHAKASMREADFVVDRLHEFLDQLAPETTL